LPVGLARNPKQAIVLYVILAAAGSAGVMIDFLPLDPIKALYWSAVINGIGPFCGSRVGVRVGMGFDRDDDAVHHRHDCEYYSF